MTTRSGGAGAGAGGGSSESVWDVVSRVATDVFGNCVPCGAAKGGASSALRGTNYGYVVLDDSGVERNARMDIDNGSNRYRIYITPDRFTINTSKELLIDSVHVSGTRKFKVLRKLEAGTKTQQEAAAKLVAAKLVAASGGSKESSEDALGGDTSGTREDDEMEDGPLDDEPEEELEEEPEA